MVSREDVPAPSWQTTVLALTRGTVHAAVLPCTTACLVLVACPAPSVWQERGVPAAQMATHSPLASHGEGLQHLKVAAAVLSHHQQLPVC
jgi:hypothetical protein